MAKKKNEPKPLDFDAGKPPWDACWESPSCLGSSADSAEDEDDRFTWVIHILKNGRFSIAESGIDLIDRRKFKDATYATFQAAVNVCQSLDNGLRVAMAKRK